MKKNKFLFYFFLLSNVKVKLSPGLSKNDILNPLSSPLYFPFDTRRNKKKRKEKKRKNRFPTVVSPVAGEMEHDRRGSIPLQRNRLLPRYQLLPNIKKKETERERERKRKR